MVRLIINTFHYVNMQINRYLLKCGERDTIDSFFSENKYATKKDLSELEKND